jgi:hypothetical protein
MHKLAPGYFFHAALDPSARLMARSVLAAAFIARSRFNLLRAFETRSFASSAVLIDFQLWVAISPSGVPSQVRRKREGILREP